MSHVFPRHCHSDLPRAVSGDGCYLIDHTGKRYFDGSGGAAVSCLGHSNARVTQAIKDQADQLAFAHTGFFTTDPAEELADMLIADAPGDLNRVYFVSGGSEAVEAAIKLARQYHIENGQPERRHLIARRQSYQVVPPEPIIPPHTVRSHLQNLYPKLAVPPKVEASAIAIRNTRL